MKLSKGFLFALILIYVFALIQPGFTQEKESTITIQQDQREKDLKLQEERKLEEKKSIPSKEAQQEHDYDIAEILRDSQSNLDRSINTLNVVATLIGILVGLITLIIIIAASLGFLENRRFKSRYEEIIKKGEKYLTYIENLTDTAEKHASKIVKEAEKIPISGITEEPSEETTEALESFMTLIKMMELFNIPLKSDHYLARASYFIKKAKYKNALKDIERSLELNPNSQTALASKSLCLYNMDRADKAENIIDRAIDINPNTSYTWQIKAIILAEIKKYNEGIIAINKAIELGKNVAATYEIKGYLLNKLGENEEALENLNKATELKPIYYQAWFYKACVLMELGKEKEAFEAFDKAIELKPTHALLWYRKSRMYSTKNDKKKMLIDLSVAVKLDPELKAKARENEDFKNFWNDEDFKNITS